MTMRRGRGLGVYYHGDQYMSFLFDLSAHYVLTWNLYLCCFIPFNYHIYKTILHKKYHIYKTILRTKGFKMLKICTAYTAD